MQAPDRQSRRDPQELSDDELEFLSDVALAVVARSPRLAPEQRNFIGQHVNHPCRVGWSVVLGWARDVLDEEQFAIVLEASRRPRIAEMGQTMGPSAGTAASRRWKAVRAELDAAEISDARLSRKVRMERARRLTREYHRSWATWIGFGMAIGLALLGYFLVGILRQEGQLEDCMMQGRHNCAALIQDR
jgi:hypothetical protein